VTEWPFGDLPHRHFACIMADPPWHFRARTALQVGNWTSRRDAEKHYNVMGIDDIAALPIRDLVAKDAHLFLWTTGPFLRQAFDVIDAWGFRYSGSGFVWIKLKKTSGRQLRLVSSGDMASELHTGLGLTTRKNAEFCLLARRGNARRNAKDIREVILSPVREHSRKPDEAFERAERYCDGPRIEIFSRQRRMGWESWGNEVDRFQEAAE
jgi:N6-adenosine-specific RNA methylase IME4